MAIMLGILGSTGHWRDRFLIIRSRNKKNTVISAIVILFLASTVLVVTPVEAGSQPAQATKYPQLPTATLYTPPPAEKGVIFQFGYWDKNSDSIKCHY